MFTDHPDRLALAQELHARPIDILEEQGRVRRLVFVTATAGELQDIIGRYDAFCAAQGMQAQASSVRRTRFSVDGRDVTWEFHTEFVTISWRSALTDKESFLPGIGLEAASEAKLLVATRIDVITAKEIPEHFIPGFAPSSLCVSAVEDGAAQIATDYVTDADGYTRLEFASGRLSPLRRSIIVRRLLEIDTYRSMAMLALPLARRVTPELGDIERELSEVLQTMPQATSSETTKPTLDALHLLSMRSGQLAERLDFRFSAAKAYGKILEARLAGLRESPLALGSTISRYLGNRVDPALATCLAVERRLEKLTDKIKRAIELLNVRIGLDLQIQNRSVLETIASTSQSQYRLQATVEGLSVIAISYYALGILGYILAGPLEIVHFEKALAVSLAAPPIILVVWWLVRRIRRKHFG